jgi:plasmid stabilization system protein ParE
MPVIIRKRAERVLAKIADFIAKDNTVRAVSFVNGLIDCCISIADHPTLARIRAAFDLVSKLQQQAEPP